MLLPVHDHSVYCLLSSSFLSLLFLWECMSSFCFFSTKMTSYASNNNKGFLPNGLYSLFESEATTMTYDKLKNRKHQELCKGLTSIAVTKDLHTSVDIGPRLTGGIATKAFFVDGWSSLLALACAPLFPDILLYVS